MCGGLSPGDAGISLEAAKWDAALSDIFLDSDEQRVARLVLAFLCHLDLRLRIKKQASIADNSY
jgi:hypothetical protein